MRIAVPTNDGASVSAHFGRSAAFLVFEVDNGEIRERQLRPNGMQHTHEQGSCGDHGAAHQPHSHAGILESLAGCDVVISPGMGWRAAEALKSAGITAVMTSAAGAPEELVRAYVKGELITGEEGFCRCSH